MWRTVLGALLCILAVQGYALDISDRFRSPRNPERKIRSSTSLIVLHTTEAGARSSLNKLCDRGECHFCVTEQGRIYRIIDRDRVAFHAGFSMWNGREQVDYYSIGIECVGYHNKPMPAAQATAIRNLLNELKAMYHLTDDKVVTHSMVAYGNPNKYWRRKHRGRKRCGMLFAMPSVRRALGLKLRPAYDPDQKAGRLVQADPYLQTVLYGKTDTMVGRFGRIAAPSGGLFSTISDWFADKPATQKPAAKTKTVAKTTKSAKSVTKAPSGKSTAAKKEPVPAKSSAKPVVKVPIVTPQTVAQLRKDGYKCIGKIKKGFSAAKLAGKKWNASTTYYTTRGKVISGDKVDASKLETGAGVWIKR